VSSVVTRLDETTGKVCLYDGKFRISPALQPERAFGQRSKAAGVVIALSKFASWDRFGLVLASIWRMSLMSIVSNLVGRMQVLQVLLTKRFIWTSLAELTYPHHTTTIKDIRGNLHPLHFGRLVANRQSPIPNFAKALGSESRSSFQWPGTPFWSSEPSAGEFLGELVYNLRPATVLELGCFVGWTSAHLALGLREAGCEHELWCVDPEKRFLEIAEANLTRVGLQDHVRFLCGGSLDDAILAKLPPVIDVIYIDTDHRYETTRREIATYAQRLRPGGGWIILHDSIMFPSVRRAVFEMSDQFHCMTFATDAPGLTVLRRKDPRADFPDLRLATGRN
jgi:predicted O-methyltransferase YrrM